MKRPGRLHNLIKGLELYLASDIDPLLDELEKLREAFHQDIHPKGLLDLTDDYIRTLEEAEQSHSHNNKNPFPSLEEFQEWYENTEIELYSASLIEQFYNYFSQFQYERVVFPKVGDMVEGVGLNDKTRTYVGTISHFSIKIDKEYSYTCGTIRPVTRPTRDELVKSITNKLENKTDKIIFDRKLVEQLLEILKGDE